MTRKEENKEEEEEKTWIKLYHLPLLYPSFGQDTQVRCKIVREIFAISALEISALLAHFERKHSVNFQVMNYFRQINYIPFTLPRRRRGETYRLARGQYYYIK